MKTSKVQNLIYKMLTENTGRALCDSGDAYGRGWERNQKRTIEDFMHDKPVETNIESWTDSEGAEHVQYDYTISVFHWLDQNLSLDDVCNQYNRLACKDWDSEIYGVSKSQEAWLKSHGLAVGNCVNTYNGDSNLSQILQYTYLDSDGGDCYDYVLMQIHNGCDARGGYTDAKLFKLAEAGGYLCEDVIGMWNDKRISNLYDGYKLTIDDDEQNGEEISPKMGDKIELDILTR